MRHHTLGAVIGDWWGYAEADATVVGIVVAAVVAFAVVYVGTRWFARAKLSGRGSGKRGRG